MNRSWRAITAAVVLGLAAPATAGPERDYNQPPPGSTPEDAALWRDLRHGTGMAQVTLGRINQSSFRIRYGRYYETLDEAAKAGPADVAAQAKAWREKLAAAAQAAADAVPEDGGGVHACRRAHLDLDIRMDELSDPKVAKEMPAVRAEARACVEKMNTLLARIEKPAEVLERTLNEIDAYLKRAIPVPPQGGSGAAGTKQPAGAETAPAKRP
jgi:hypothetical protein